MKTKTSIIVITISMLCVALIATVAYGYEKEERIYVAARSSNVIEPGITIDKVEVKVFDERVPKDSSKRCPQWEHKFEEYGLPVDVFSYIAWRESRCNPKAINAKFDKNGKVIWTLNKDGSIDRGLIQVNSTWKTVTRNVCGTSVEGLLDIDCNLSVAKYLMDNTKGKLRNWSINN